MTQDNSQSRLIPLPLVKDAARYETWSKLYYDAQYGHLGRVSRLGSRKYVEYASARAYLERVRPGDGPAALDRLLQPEIVVAGK